MATPTQAQIDAGFAAAKVQVDSLVDNLVGSWAESDVTDDEIHQISDAVVQAVINVPTTQGVKK